MESQKAYPKMFLEIVGELRNLIKEENIKTGGKLPSERELAERMKVGRSTVREALRSLELLGLIETRRGEGTFLADFQKNQFVDVLSGFILQQPNSIKDVIETRKIHEFSAIQTICSCTTLQKLPVWNGFLLKIEQQRPIKRIELVREMIVATGNRLSLKIWMLLMQYSQVPYAVEMTAEEKESIKDFLAALIVGDNVQALTCYANWSERVEGNRGGKVK